jgi:hypothetical protein
MKAADLPRASSKYGQMNIQYGDTAEMEPYTHRHDRVKHSLCCVEVRHRDGTAFWTAFLNFLNNFFGQ